MRFVERLAVRIARRGLIGLGLFAAVADGAALAGAGRCRNRPTSRSCHCAPPGPYCDEIDPAWCDGARCGEGCEPNDENYPRAAWCTATCRHGGRPGHYVCRDCLCPGGSGIVSCGCRTFVRAG